MRTKVFYLDRREEAERVAAHLGGKSVRYTRAGVEMAFLNGERIVALTAAGIILRALAPHMRSKWVDPPVVLVTPDLTLAIPLLGGHHGANELARELEGIGIRAVITTATESRGLEAVEVAAARRALDVVNRDSTRAVNAALLKGYVPICSVSGPSMVVVGPGVSVLCRKGEYVVGIGCNRGTTSAEIRQAIDAALRTAGIGHDEVMLYATTERKVGEAGLREAVEGLGMNLVFLGDHELNAQPVEQSKASLIGLRGVAEPAALALSRRKEMVLGRKAYGNVTVAIAR